MLQIAAKPWIYIMAFDSGFVTAITAELSENLTDGKIEKVYQPENDELVLLVRARGDNHRLLISASANNPRINITTCEAENPKTAPMFCMLLRKHLTGGKISAITQYGFERCIEIAVETRDELEFLTKRYLIVEIMGKYSNIILLGKDRKIINAIKNVDFSISQKRQVLPGLAYEYPPAQNKRDPFNETKEAFSSLLSFNETAPDKFILKNYLGMSPLVAREIAYFAAEYPDGYTSNRQEGLWKSFSRVVNSIKTAEFTPSIVYDENERPIEFSFFPIMQYGIQKCRTLESFSELIDVFYTKRNKIDKMKQRSQDIMTLLTNAQNRIQKKIALQKNDLIKCRQKEEYKLFGDLITANIYRLKRGMDSAELVNYRSENGETVTVELDRRLNPAQNAQRYYKHYNKSKTAETELAKQISTAEAELAYLDTVFHALSEAEFERDLEEIRHELYLSGYASKMKNYTVPKSAPVKPMEFMTSGGYKVICGKNNSQNDYITFKLATKLDLWFHVKNIPGSHTVLFCNGEEPSAEDYTQTAMIAAVYSKAVPGQKVAVDYTRVKNLKKPSGAKPGFVTYQTNYSAYVTPDEEAVKKLRIK